MAAARFLQGRLKASLLAVAMLLAFVIVPYLFWHGAWFGRPLADPELMEYLSARDKPRRIQHALAQMAERIEKGDSQVERWYQPASELADHPSSPVRVMLAWTLGHDPGSELFHTTLHDLLQDESLLVRRNAALSLVRFGDNSGLAELRSMLLSHTVPAASAGPIRYLVERGELVEPGTALFELSEEKGNQVQAILGGRVQRLLLPPGLAARPGDPVLEISPDLGHVWEALRALALVGRPEELPMVEAILKNPSMSQTVRSQAALTRQSIQERSGTPEPTPSGSLLPEQ